MDQTHQQAFELITRELTSDTVLALYDPNKRSILVTDASNHALGGILLQKDEDGYERPVHYVGTALRTHEKIYSTIEKEAYALIWCIEKLHLYLYQTEFDVRVDHQPLEFIFGLNAKPSARVERWQLRLQPYRFNIMYHRGKENISDFISRIKNLPKPVETTNTVTENYVYFIQESSVPHTLTLDEIRAATAKDPELIELMTALRTGNFHQHPVAKQYEKLQYELCVNNIYARNVSGSKWIKISKLPLTIANSVNSCRNHITHHQSIVQSYRSYHGKKLELISTDQHQTTKNF